MTHRAGASARRSRGCLHKLGVFAVLWGIFLLSIWFVAFRRRDPGPPPVSPPPAPGTVHPGDRVAWEQPLLDRSDPEAYRFRLLIDGHPAELPDALCGNVSPLHTVTCSARIPPLAGGPHRLEVVALALGPSGRDSAPSPTLHVTAR
jgi:hypothetical protein